MSVVCFDTETALIRPGLLAPPIVCVSWCFDDGEPCLAHWTDSEELLRTWLAADDLIVGHNVAYDLAVAAAQWPHLLPAIFAAYDADRVTDTMIREQLLHIAEGTFKFDHGVPVSYDLQSVARRHTGRVLEKDEWRLRYGEFRDVPLSWWPEGAQQYPKEDARATRDVYFSQERVRTSGGSDWIPSQFHEARAAFAQHLQSCWGLRTDERGVRSLREGTEKALADLRARLEAAGLVRPDGTRDTKAAAARMEEVYPRCPRTPTGKPKLDGDTCENSGDPLLEAYGEFTTYTKVLSTDVKMLEAGLVVPVQTRYGMAESGRATSSGPNIQNLRRMPGVREAFVPRPGFVFVDADYPALELWSLAQVQLHLFGRSRLAEVLNAGKDPHTELACFLLGISYEEGLRRKEDKKDHEFGDARQLSKAANFGYPGGLGAEKFVRFAAASGISIDEARARELKASWNEQWEMGDYFRHINQLCSTPDELAQVELPSTGMKRGGARFCAAANTYFQGLGAAATKCSGWILARRCYVERDHVLFGCRPVAVIHDEFLVEIPEDQFMHERAMAVAQCMTDGAARVMPDCVPRPIKPEVCRYWSKEAVQVKDSNGRLVPWPKAA